VCDTPTDGYRYYEDLREPFGQHRWVEYSNIHDYDATMIQPEWHGIINIILIFAISEFT
jgi:NADH:ubiquinone oxidoreductase subunit